MTEEEKEGKGQKLFGKTASDKPPKREEWVEESEEDSAEEKDLKKRFFMDP